MWGDFFFLVFLVFLVYIGHKMNGRKFSAPAPVLALPSTTSDVKPDEKAPSIYDVVRDEIKDLRKLQRQHDHLQDKVDRLQKRLLSELNAIRRDIPSEVMKCITSTPIHMESSRSPLQKKTSRSTTPPPPQKQPPKKRSRSMTKTEAAELMASNALEEQPTPPLSESEENEII